MTNELLIICSRFYLRTQADRHAHKDRYLLYKQFLAHSDALVEPLLVLLQEFLLFIDLSPQVTVSLLRRDSEEDACNTNKI